MGALLIGPIATNLVGRAWIRCEVDRVLIQIVALYFPLPGRRVRPVA